MPTQKPVHLGFRFVPRSDSTYASHSALLFCSLTWGQDSPEAKVDDGEGRVVVVAVGTARAACEVDPNGRRAARGRSPARAFERISTASRSS